MLKVIAQSYIRPDSIAEARILFEELVRLSRAEPLCISYDLFVDQEDPGHFIFVETWPDRSALAVHDETEHFRRLVPQIRALASRPGSLMLMDAF